MKTLIKLPFKILAIPFVPAFFLLSIAMKFMGWLGGRILVIATLILGVGGAGVLFSGDISGGIALLVMSFLVSPLGIPAIAEGIGGLLDGANASIIGFIAG